MVISNKKSQMKVARCGKFSFEINKYVVWDVGLSEIQFNLFLKGLVDRYSELFFNFKQISSFAAMNHSNHRARLLSMKVFQQ